MTAVQIRGIVDEILYEDADGRAVFRLMSNSKYLRALGKVGKVHLGETWIINGDWEEHFQHGRQFKVYSGYPVPPDTQNELIALFSGDKFEGVGIATASRLVKHYGDNLWGILEKHPTTLFTDGIVTRNKSELIIKSFVGLKHQWKVIRFLVENKLPFRLAEPLVTLYGKGVLVKISENPYRLLSFLDWKNVDQLAINLGVKTDDDNRLKAAIVHILQVQLSKGNTAVNRDFLTEQVERLLKVPKETFERHLEEPLVYFVGENFVQLPGIASQEKMIAKVFKSLATSSIPLANDQWVESWLDNYENNNNFKLDSLQREAVKSVVNNRITVLTGGPGSGKTSVVDAIRLILQDLDQPVILSAPTGRAAKRLQESTGLETKTLHRLFKYSIWDFSFKNNNEIANLIVDECSMVDLRMWSMIVRGVGENTRLILVGDPNQLPPIGAGQVFYDIVNNSSIPVVQLTKIHRQASDNPIPYVSRDIKDGKLPLLPSWNFETKGVFLIEEIDEEKGLDLTINLAVEELKKAKIPIEDIQILSPRKNNKTGTKSINEQIRQNLGLKDISEIIPFALGDRVIQTVNNYDLGENGVMNGSVGVVVDHNGKSITIDFDGEEINIPHHATSDIDHAYSISVHKSQGSQYRVVLLPLYGSLNNLLTRQLVYTAITRATDLIIIVGSKNTLTQTIMNSSTSKRVTGLPIYLK
ncbi:AAA family ATPase [Neobacillus sp. NPDC093127]|uniref:SF1B family DNA helicase RecD2 n=1 Tax=Neobacillus sp. NPDC093127 TaxID=3364296 RepID=UPI0037FC7C4D